MKAWCEWAEKPTPPLVNNYKPTKLGLTTGNYPRLRKFVSLCQFNSKTVTREEWVEKEVLEKWKVMPLDVHNREVLRSMLAKEHDFWESRRCGRTITRGAMINNIWIGMKQQQVFRRQAQAGI